MKGSLHRPPHQSLKSASEMRESTGKKVSISFFNSSVNSPRLGQTAVELTLGILRVVNHFKWRIVLYCIVFWLPSLSAEALVYKISSVNHNIIWMELPHPKSIFLSLSWKYFAFEFLLTCHRWSLLSLLLYLFPLGGCSIVSKHRSWNFYTHSSWRVALSDTCYDHLQGITCPLISLMSLSSWCCMFPSGHGNKPFGSWTLCQIFLPALPLSLYLLVSFLPVVWTSYSELLAILSDLHKLDLNAVLVCSTLLCHILLPMWRLPHQWFLILSEVLCFSAFEVFLLKAYAL